MYSKIADGHVEMQLEGFPFRQQMAAQVEYFLFNQADRLKECCVPFPGGIIQPPILSLLAWKEGAVHIAAHCYDHICRRNVRKQLAVLRLFHINAVDFFHQADSVLVDLRLCLRASGAALKHITGKTLEGAITVAANPGETDVISSCTIGTDDFLKLIVKAGQ